MPKLRTIVGHQRQVEQLQQDMETGNIAHAYLFSGPAHLGKMSIAYWFASEILTRGFSVEEKANASRSIGKLTHPDLLVLDQLWIEKQCEDWDVIARSSNVNQQHRSRNEPAKTDTISIDDVRALQERLHETSLGFYRCCIIRSVERMQEAAANALLKILEEPPEHLVFILTTQAQSSLLPTIISRARSLRFLRLPRRELQPILEEVNEDDAHFILRLAQGAPGIVYRLRDDPDSLRLEKQVYEKALSFWGTASLKSRLQILTSLHTRGDEADRFLTHLALSLRQQPPRRRELLMPPFMELARSLRTNAHRQLAAQYFALVTAP
ncbi:hypothetical protein A2454_02645 [Candidatus Peribacteria bacterium RIFOXYC2_FULL_55_14]|nr:MAG: polymerase III, delta prime subunit protein [Candidatus Peribacteria bacterium GW2011_GWB1_54_5]KKW39458.1 MAG: polymerase III, delta prime subunit protein [Candidatus Peribacteria bacterium GW2011_GWC2_54_8]OGJ73708.1 MAG: hypothetical protein A2384_03970 [Candidatus Peribacteria bacterium RIFOXYB1_FULL_54_35]OGJ74836.1 MAG: hypothetical protein A2217_02440 [Candidatus Peribacteria bacterium RIFOXYA2_FULL_55_28]OGJ77124.1 MAG: hypothetical protein A2327_05545 [Candidatus Peribacteria b